MAEKHSELVKQDHNPTGAGHGIPTRLGADGNATQSDVLHPTQRASKVSLQERLFYATLQRRSYRALDGTPDQAEPGWYRFFEPKGYKDPALGISDKQMDQMTRRDLQPAFDIEKQEARRALRNAGWAAMFFLITTDVIGPFNAPYAFSTVGYVGGFLLYFTFGAAVIYGSFVLLNLYLRLDSDRYPIRNYGDLVNVFLGPGGKYAVALMQIVQIVFIAGTNIIANAQSMTLLTAGSDGAGSLCFIVSIVIWTVVGFAISVPFRSLKNLSFLGSFDVFINLLVLFMSMGFIAHSPPNYTSAAAAYGYDINPPAPISATATVSGTLSNQVNGAMNMVFAWSGLMIYVEFMAEMRNPYKFWKSFMCSEFLILVVYVMYGAYVYGLQGQYTLPVAFQGVSKYTWQSIGNGLSLWTYTMASVLYLNIAVKVAYWLIFEDWFNGPPIYSKKGRIIWTIMQAAAWGLAFVIGTAIPQVQTLQALIGAALLLQFSYTLPPMMQFLLEVRLDAAREDPVYKLGQPVQRVDTWRSAARWKRGLFTGRVWFKVANLLLCAAGLATCGLGIWGSVLTIEATFMESAATSFGCTAPV